MADALDRRLLCKVLPRTVVQFLQQAWSQVLLLVSLKYGEQSLQWQAALRTMDELIWSVSLQQDTEAGRHLLEQLPGLLKALREGLTGFAFDPFSTREFFVQLQALHLQAPEGIDGLIEVREPFVFNAAPQEPVPDLPDNDPDLLQRSPVAPRQLGGVPARPGQQLALRRSCPGGPRARRPVVACSAAIAEACCAAFRVSIKIAGCACPEWFQKVFILKSRYSGRKQLSN